MLIEPRNVRQCDLPEVCGCPPLADDLVRLGYLEPWMREHKMVIYSVTEVDAALVRYRAALRQSGTRAALYRAHGKILRSDKN